MPLPPEHAFALQGALEALCAPMRVKVLRVGHDAVPPSQLRGMAQALMRRRHGANTVQIGAALDGWGQSLEARRVSLRLSVDPALDPADAAADALERVSPALGRQLELCAQASAVGIREPLTGAQLRSTAHLFVDADAIPVLVDHIGTAEAARGWLDEQMEWHARSLDPRHPEVATAPDPTIRVVGARLHVPFALSPLRVARGSGPDSDAPVWEDDVLYVNGALPDGVSTSLIGRAVGDLVSGTPIGHRRILSVDGLDFGGAQTLVLMETPLARVDEVLPPALHPGKG